MKKRLIPVVSMICALACFSVVPAQAQHPTNEQLRVSWVVENIIKKGDLEGLKQELRRGDLRVNAADQNGNALLMHACKEGKDDMVSMLLANGANVNRQDKDGMTALMYAREPSTGKMLLDNGAAVNIKDKNGKTALMYAADNGRTKIVKMLLDNGAAVNAQDKDGKTALMYTVRNVRLYEEKMLLDHGAAVNLQDKNGKTALMYAADCHPDLVKVLLDNGAAVNLQDKDGNTALMRSVKSANSEVTQIFLDYNADITIINHEGQTIWDIIKEAEKSNWYWARSECRKIREMILKKVVSSPSVAEKVKAMIKERMKK